MSSKLLVVSGPNCTKCHFFKERLKSEGVSYTEYSAGELPAGLHKFLRGNFVTSLPVFLKDSDERGLEVIVSGDACSSVDLREFK